MLESISKLEPGHAMIIREGRIVRKWQYYDLPYTQGVELIPEMEAVEEVHEQIKNSVNRQMVADVPVGAFLSGGLDSSSVVTFAKQFTNNQKLQCFTIGFKDDSFKKEGMADDLPYAQRVAKHLGVDLHTIDVGPEMADQLEWMIYHLDEPQADPAPLNVYFISKLAKESGIKVLLSGAGGDDIFSGYRRHYALLQEQYWSWLPGFFRKVMRNFSSRLPENTAPGRRLAKAFRFADREQEERLAGYFHWLEPSCQWNLYSQPLKESLANETFSAPLLRTLSKLPRGTDPLNKMLYLEGKHFLADHNLNYTDKMSMACGVEVRVPLLDPDLVALAARLPVSYKQNGREGKWIFKKAMEPYLPHDVIYRPKTGFGAPLRSWLRHELRPVVEDVLSAKSLQQRGLFDPRGVQRLIEMDRSGQVDGTYPIFSLMCIELWCRIFLDQPVPLYHT